MTKTNYSDKIRYKTLQIDGLDIFYREAGSKEASAILLLHGFPTSSHMFHDLMIDLSDKFHVIAPDYPGFGNSSMPLTGQFEYTFDHLAEVMNKFTEKVELRKYSLYMMDYGAPIGFRLAVKHPECIESLIIQNGNAYEEGFSEAWEPIMKYWKNKTPQNAQALRKFLTLDVTKWQYTHGTHNIESINPDNWNVDQYFLDRPGNAEIQLDLFYDYQTNVTLYPKWQEYLRKYQPPTIILWGKNDPFFLTPGALAYKKDLKNIYIHLLDTGHFALEEEGKQIAEKISEFLSNLK